MRKTIVLFGVTLALLLGAVFVVQATTTVSEERIGTVHKLVYSWSTNITDTETSGTSIEAYTGQIVKAYIVPSASNPPPDGYDVALYDQSGIDLLEASGANQISVTTGIVNAEGWVANDTLTLSVTNVATDTAGTVYVYVKIN
jgi:hypothetical protein